MMVHRPLVVVVGSSLLLGIVLLGSLAWRGDGETAPTPPAPAAALPAADAAYFTALAAPLGVVAAETRALVELGESRSRNLLAIRAAQDRTADAFDRTDGVIASRATPARFAASVRAYQNGSAAVRQAMADAQAAFLRLDWERVATATKVLNRGAAEIDRAVSLLVAATATATATVAP